MSFMLCKNPGIRKGIPTVKINENGTFTLNNATVVLFNMIDVKYINFYFDLKVEKLGINPCNRGDVGAVRVNKTKAYSLKGVFAYFNIEGEKYIGKYAPQNSDTTAFLFEIDLTNKI